MKIGVMGAGGIGGYLGARFAEAGHDVQVVARGPHLAAIRDNGLRLESPHGDFHARGILATEHPEEIGPVDVIIFAVKLKDTREAAEAMAPMIGAGTRVVTLQNGIDSKRLISASVPEGQIAAGIIYLAAYIKEPGVIFNPGGLHKAVIDRLDDDPVMTDFLDAAAKLVGADISGTDQIERVVWDKFVALAAFAAVTGITRLPIGAVYENPATLDLFAQLIDENVAIARARGINFKEDHAQGVIDVFGQQPYSQKSSMLIDLEAGKPLELPWLSGRMHELGLELGIPTPANSTVFAALSPYINGAPKKEE